MHQEFSLNKKTLIHLLPPPPQIPLAFCLAYHVIICGAGIDDVYIFYGLCRSSRVIPSVVCSDIIVRRSHVSNSGRVHHKTTIPTSFPPWTFPALLYLQRKLQKVGLALATMLEPAAPPSICPFINLIHEPHIHPSIPSATQII